MATSPSCPRFWLWLHGLFVDTYVGSIVSWACSLHHDTELVLYALCRACTYEHIRDTSFGAGESITFDTGSYIALASANRCCLGALSPRLARLEMHLATHLQRRPSGLEDRVYREGSPFRIGPIATLADLEEIT